MEVACSTEIIDSTNSSSRCPVPVEHNPISCIYVSQYIRLTKNDRRITLCSSFCVTRSSLSSWVWRGASGDVVTNPRDRWPMTRCSISGMARDFYVRHGIRTVFEAHPPSCPVDSEKSLPRNKAAGHESDHLRPSNSTVKNAWICASTPPCAWIVWRFIKRWDNFVVTHWRVKGQVGSCRLGSEYFKGSGHRTEQPTGQNGPVDELVCDILLVLFVMRFWTRAREESGKEVEPVDLQSTARCKKTISRF